MRSSVCACLVWLTSGIAFAQGGGFQAGDLYLYNATLPISGSGNGAILRIDPALQTSSLLVDLGVSFQRNGVLAFDPYRQRLVFHGGIGASSNPAGLYAVDAAGNLTDLGIVGANFDGLSPTGTGRIYMLQSVLATPFVYIDEVNSLSVLMDAAGTAPFQLTGSGFQLRTMIYDAPSHALLVAASSGYPCPGGLSARINVFKLPLSPDGTRVVGPVGCVQFDIGGGGGVPVGMSRLPDGDLLIAADNNTTALTPRFFRLDPATLATAAFATNDNTGCAATSSGSYCSVLARAVGFYGGNGLVMFADGEAGSGTPLSVTGVPISGSGTGFAASLTSIEPSPCSGAWLVYGVGKKGAGDFVPRLYGAGCPDVGSTFSITIDRGVGGAPGVLFVALAKSNLPFLGGSLLAFPIAFQLDVVLSGSGGVPGTGTLVLPAAVGSNPAVAGISVYLQGLFADASATQGVSFTQGLQMVIGS